VFYFQHLLLTKGRLTDAAEKTGEGSTTDRGKGLILYTIKICHANYLDQQNAAHIPTSHIPMLPSDKGCTAMLSDKILG
jgi:hypothetical protein